MDKRELEAEIELLSDMWGTDVHITYRTGRREWLVSNTTDEGLPTRVESKVVYGNTLREALEKAKNGEFRHS